jgi:hypothetical protein
METLRRSNTGHRVDARWFARGAPRAHAGGQRPALLRCWPPEDERVARPIRGGMGDRDTAALLLTTTR